MDIGQHSDKNRLGLLFFAALLFVVLSVALFGTPVNAVPGPCTVKFLNQTNLTTLWGQNFTIGINVTHADDSPAVSSVFKLDVRCARGGSFGLCSTSANQTGAGPTGTTDANGLASISLPASQSPLYQQGGPAPGAPGGPFSPGPYFLDVNYVGGADCTEGANHTGRGISIRGYYPAFAVTNIVNASTNPSQYLGDSFNISLFYPAPAPGIMDVDAGYSSIFKLFNVTIGSGSNARHVLAVPAVGTGNAYIVLTSQNPAVAYNPMAFTAATGSSSTMTINASAWSRDRMYVNISAVTQDGWYVAYANTTVNYINIQVIKSDGSPFTGSIFMWKMNGTTKMPMVPAGWGLDDAQAPPFLPLTAGTFTINCYDPESRCLNATRPMGMYNTTGSILGPGQTSGIMTSELENAPIQLVAYDMGSSNVTDIFPVTPYANMNAINLTLNNSGAMSQFSVRTLSQMQGEATLTHMKVYDSDGVLRYVINSSLPDEFARSAPLKIGTNYRVEINGTEESGQPFTIRNITYTPAFRGFGGALILVWNASFPSASHTTIKGQVLSQFAGARNITVYAEPRECHGGGPFVSVCIANSTLTDANGLFQMRVPRIPGMNEYKLTAVDARRMGDGISYSGALIHYPTTDDNNDRYYRAQGDNLIVPPINMTYAGTMNLNVGVSAQVFGVMAELSRLRQLATGWVRDSFANRMAMANAFGDFMKTAAPITALTFPMDSPTNGSSTVTLFFWGMGMTGTPGPNNPPTIIAGARNTTTVNWRQISPVRANTSQNGNLVLYVSMCNGGSVLNQAPAANRCATPTALDPMGQGDGNSYWNFWWNSKVIIYTAGNYSQPYQYLQGEEDNMFLARGKIPLMPGTYGMEIASKYDWEKPISQNRMINFTVSPGADTNLTVYVYSPGWEIKSWVFPYTMRRSSANEIHAGVFDFAQMGGNPMLGPSSKVNLTFQAVNMNGTAAMPPVNVSYLNVTYPDGKVAEVFRLMFTPSQWGLPAGKYIGLFRANLTNYTINPFNSTNMAGAGTAGQIASSMPGYYANLYITNKPWEYQFVVSDFDIGTEPYKRSFVPGETIKATLYGFNNTQPVGSEGLNGTVATYIFNEAGKRVAVNQSYRMLKGVAGLTISAPTAVGWYEIMSVVNVTQNALDIDNTGPNMGWGLSNMWLKVSNFGFEDKYDKRSYSATDVVNLGVTLTNGTTGAAIPNAAITAFVDQDQTPIFAMTDLKGRATFQLSKSAGWSYGGHNVRMTVNSFNQSGNNEVVNEEFFSWFEVGGIDVNFYPTKNKYSVTDTVTVNVYSTSVGDSSEFTLYVDGNQTGVTWTQRGAGYWTADMAPQGQWLPGRHFMSLQVGQGGKGTAAFHGGFETAAVNLFITMNRSEYNVGDTAGFTVKVINATTMSPVPNAQPVSGNLYKMSAGSNKRMTMSTAQGFTDGNAGTAFLNSSLPESGYYIIEARYMGQSETATFRVSGVTVTIAGTSQTWAAGDTLQFVITSLAQSTIEPTLWAYGEKISMPTGTTNASGIYVASYSLPSDAPSGTYTLDVKATTNTSVLAFNTTSFAINNAYRIRLSSGRSSVQAFSPGESATLRVSLTNGTVPAPGVNVTFAIGGGTVTDSTKGTAISDSSGKASVSTTVPSSDGIYYAKAYVTDSPEVSAYATVIVASLNVTFAVTDPSTGTANDSLSYNPGSSVPVTYNVTVKNSTTGSVVNFSDGSTTGSMSVLLFNENGGEVSQSFNTSMATSSSSGMYSMTSSMPNATSSLGSYTMVAMVRANNSMGIVTKTVNMNTAGLKMNVTTNPAAASITAGQTSFNVTVNVFNRAGAGQSGTAAVTIFSPTASGTPLYYAASYPVSSGVANINVSAANITAPGVYVIKAEFTGAGGSAMNSTIIRVRSAATPQSLGVVSVSSTSVNITSNVPNATAYVMTESGGRTTTMALTLVPNATGTNYYTTVTALNSSATYFVRLDTVNSTGVNTTMFKTS